MDDLITFLRAQLDEDERIAQEAVQYGDADWHLNSADNVALSSSLTTGGEQLVPITADRWRHPMIEGSGPVAHIAAHDPARVLRETDAKRKILDEFEQADRYSRTTWGQSNADQSRARTLGKVVRLLALPFADRPGFREEWRP
jgi:hypothetical protein